MPGMWGGQRQNPMLAFGMEPGSPPGDSDEDSLGNLSEFEDADFEAFADSLLDDTLDDELFGYNRAAPEFGRGVPTMDDDLDSLSDFENDEGPQAGYLGVGADIDDDTDGTDDDIDLFGAQPTFGVISKTNSMIAQPKGNTIRSAAVGTQHHLNRDSLMSLGAASMGSMGSLDSLSEDGEDGEVVIAQPAYEAVGQAWNVRAGERGL